MDIQNLKVAWGGANKSRVIQPTGRYMPRLPAGLTPMPGMGCRRGWKVFLATFFWSEFLGNGVEILHVAHF